ncbi:MAG: hypothetical protein BGP01_10025 [Paludibacter sp. 47-17]|nr:MAG: hypothetical protein BGP01_10025 [Paludibacter sp. 47-17]
MRMKVLNLAQIKTLLIGGLIKVGNFSKWFQSYVFNFEKTIKFNIYFFNSRSQYVSSGTF